VTRVHQRKPYRTQWMRTVSVLSLIFWASLFSAFAQLDAKGEAVNLESSDSSRFSLGIE
jgi:hypothetical protein